MSLFMLFLTDFQELCQIGIVSRNDDPITSKVQPFFYTHLIRIQRGIVEQDHIKLLNIAPSNRRSEGSAEEDSHWLDKFLQGEMPAIHL